MTLIIPHALRQRKPLRCFVAAFRGNAVSISVTPSLRDANSNHARPWLSSNSHCNESASDAFVEILGTKSTFRQSGGSRPRNPRWD